MSDPKGPHVQTMVAPPDDASGEIHAQAATMHSSSGQHAAISGSRLDAYIGRVLDGRYLLEEPIGEGGMGFVYRGRHQVIDKRVAVKILRGDLAAEREMTDRFLNEARAASSIGNPHIVDISDFGRLDDGATYFVMEFLDGQSLADLMTSLGVVPVPRIVHIAKQIARGLSAAHARGIVHRDLKPDNVMLIERGGDKDFVKILDFGIAKVGGATGRLTKAGSVFGTPHYMSPEQAAGLQVDARTDIYSMGIILYEMASGKVPFDADNFMGILTQHMYKAPAPFRALVPQPQEVPPGLEAIVLKCLSKKSDLRYQSMDELVTDLERVEQGGVPVAVAEMMARSGGFNVPADYFRNQQRAMPGGPAMVAASPQLPPKRTSLVALVAIAGLLVLGAVGGGLVWYSKAHAKIEPITAPVDTATAPAPTDTTTATSTAGVGTPTASQKITVLVATEPADGTITIEGSTDKPQTAPAAIAVAPGESVKIRVERPGYVTKTVTLDLPKTVTAADGPQKRTVRLDRDFSKTAPPPKPTAKATATPPASATTKPNAQPKTCPPGKHMNPFGDCDKDF